jgi:HSP20 family protein
MREAFRQELNNPRQKAASTPGPAGAIRIFVTPFASNAREEAKPKGNMKVITRRNVWDPIQELNELQNRVNTIFGRTLLRPENGEESLTLADWVPAVDISEDEKEFAIKAELPGLKREEVKVTVEDGVLSISGERKTEQEEKNKKFHRVERSYGSFLRSFTLPEGADTSKVNAEFADGVLNVRLAKSPKAQPKTIEVK